MFLFYFLKIRIGLTSDWANVDVLSDLPSARSGHTITTYEGELYLFGGCDLTTKCYNDLQKFNNTEYKWVQIATIGNPPSEREGHIAILVGSLLYIYGGASLTEILGDVYTLNLKTLEWQEFSISGRADPRAYHAGVLHENGLIFIFGGHTEIGVTDEVLLMDTINKHWGHPSTIGKSPSARKLHSLNRVDDKVWLFGGDTSDNANDELWYYHLYQRHWYKVTSNNPSKRHGHSTVTHGSLIYLLAGCNSYRQECYSDLYTFDTSNEDWTTVIESENLPQREASAIEFIGGLLYVFGGRYLMEDCLSDFWEYETDQPCPDDCSGNGDCKDFGCDCFSGFSGSSCAVKTVCRMNCNSHGTCEDFACICYPGYYGSYCQGLVGCPNNCTSGLQGVCQDSSECRCYEGYTGEDCALKEDWKVCEDLCVNGKCDNLECVCDSGWLGIYCDVQASISYNYDYEVSDISVSYNEDSSSSSSSKTTDASEDYSEIIIISSSDVSLTEENFSSLTASQDVSADLLKTDLSIHLLIPEMFGFTNPADPTLYYNENLRRDPGEEEKEQWIVDLENKQQDRENDIDSCSLSCSFHGVCYSGLCYCEKGFTGEKCEILEEDISSGIKLSDALIATICLAVVGCCIGSYYLNKILKEIKMREESQVEENLP